MTTTTAVSGPSAGGISARRNVENVLFSVRKLPKRITPMAVVSVPKAGSRPTAMKNVLAAVDIQEIRWMTGHLSRLTFTASIVLHHLDAVVSMDASMKISLWQACSTYQETARLYPIQVCLMMYVFATVLIPPRLVSFVIRK